MAADADVAVPYGVLSFDIGTVNLAAALVGMKPGWTSTVTAYRDAEESRAMLLARAFSDFLHHGWCLHQWANIDIFKSAAAAVDGDDEAGATDDSADDGTDAEDAEGGKASTKKATATAAAADMPKDVALALALASGLQSLEASWFTAAGRCAPHTLVAELQPNLHGAMQNVFTGLIVFFARSMPDTRITGIKGTHKLKVCDALGFPEGAGLAAKALGDAATPKRLTKIRDLLPLYLAAGPECRKAGGVSARKQGGGGGGGAGPPFGSVFGRRRREQKKSQKNGNDPKYDDNKLRAMLAVEYLVTRTAAGRPYESIWRQGAKPEAEAEAVKAKTAKGKRKGTAPKQDDIADALLQGLWKLWECGVQYRAPAKPRKAATKAATKKKAATTKAAPPKSARSAGSLPCPRPTKQVRRRTMSSSSSSSSSVSSLSTT